MKITEVKVFPVRDKKLRAFASIVFEASFMVNDIKIIQGKDGYFISMPSRRRKNGRFKDIAHPLNQETRQAIEDRVLAEYRRVAEGGEAPPAGSAASQARQDAAAPAAEVPGSAAAAPTSPPDTDGSDAAGEEAPDEPRREATEDEERSLDEVAEHHLSDSYWTT